MSKVLTKELLVKAGRVRVEKVDIPEKGTAHVRTITLPARDRIDIAIYESTKADQNALAAIRIPLLAAAVCDEAGKAMFTPAELAELALPPDIAGALFDAALALNGYAGDGEEGEGDPPGN